MTRADTILRATLRAAGYDSRESCDGEALVIGDAAVDCDDYEALLVDVARIVAPLGATAEWDDDDIIITSEVES